MRYEITMQFRCRRNMDRKFYLFGKHDHINCTKQCFRKDRKLVHVSSGLALNIEKFVRPDEQADCDEEYKTDDVAATLPQPVIPDEYSSSCIMC